MKRSISALFLLASFMLGSALPARAQDRATPAQAEVTRLLNEIYTAIRGKDERFLTRALADEHPITQRHGALKTRAQWLAELRSGETSFTVLTLDQIRVLVDGDAAIATYVVRNQGRIAGQPREGLSRATRVFLRRDGRWRSAAVQYTGMEGS
jgi:ketosteroid isomerase-like protein